MSDNPWVDTLNLPQTEFPMKAKLSQREPLFLEKWREMDLYHTLLKEREEAPLFILHDGPPYANGRIHLGTAMNKILKDFIVKYKTMQGFKAPYVPGWDCHGLPIEKKVDAELGDKKKTLKKSEIRRECRRYAEKFIDLQREEFVRLGVLGEWQKPYLTLDHEYEANILKCFLSFVENGNIFKKKKPIHWCPNCQTALAEAEIEYNDHVSPSVYVAFPFRDLDKRFPEFKGEDASVLIWTTTPWTLPANLAIALHTDFDYTFFRHEGKLYLAASQLLKTICDKFGWKECDCVKTVKGKEMEGLTASNPLFPDRASLLVTAPYVTLDAGTGCVHTAPGHGEDDYLTGLRYGLDIYAPVDGEGRFDKTVPPYMGLKVFEANKVIIEDLRESGLLVLQENFTHSYPHCWRCKKPVIFRATEQWFIAMDQADLRQKALKAIEGIKWLPPWGEERIRNMVSGRPDWCISRQRSWGVPIPAFRCKDCGQSIADPELIKRAIRVFEEKGSDSWFEEDLSLFLPEGYQCPSCGSHQIIQEEDILDVWFESGASNSILTYKEGHRYPADVYLEGNDQYRGWFQSSLLVGLSARKQAPYKTVITHGWVLDEKGRAMSKSMGNVVEPHTIVKDKGAEIIRLWVAMVNYQEDLKYGENILAGLSEAYKKLRNTWRFLLGNLTDFDPSTPLRDHELSPVDLFLLSRYKELGRQIFQAYEEFAFHKVYHLIYDFFVLDLSAFYLNIKKDLLYCSYPNDPSRRATQAVMFEVLRGTLLMTAPLLPFTTEEAWSFMPTWQGKRESVHLERMPSLDLPGLEGENLKAMEKIMEIRENVLKELELRRGAKEIGDSLEADVTITLPADLYEATSALHGFMKELLVVSELRVIRGDLLSVAVTRCGGVKCPRCWNYSNEAGKDPDHPDLCPRCAEAVKHCEER